MFAADVCIELVGKSDADTSGPMWLDATSAAQRPFRRGQLDTFKLRGSTLSGAPLQLKVWLGEHSRRQDWQLSWISVVSNSVDAPTYFCFDRWLDGSGIVSACVVPPA